MYHEMMRHGCTSVVHTTGVSPKGRFLLTTLNAYSRIRSLTQEDVDSGRFNPITMVEHYTDEWDLPEGKKRVEVKERSGPLSIDWTHGIEKITQHNRTFVRIEWV